MRAALFALLLGLTTGSAAGQSQNLNLVGQLDPQPGGSYSDVWGYVGPDGREYALLASWIVGGLNVIDVTDTVPVLEEHVPVNGDGSDVEAYSHYAYVTSNDDPTQVINLADPTNPAPLGTFGPGRHTLSIAGNYLYTNGEGGVYIYSLANPASPALVGQYNPGFYIHDVLVLGDVMYTAGIYGDGIDIVNIANRAAPTRISRFNYPGSGAHNICADASGRYLYVGDEIGSGRWTRIFDVADPMDVEQVGEIIIDASSTVHNCHVRGNFLFLAHYDRGAWVYDISDPVNPEQVGYYETGVSSWGVWSFFPHLPSGKLLASDIENGLIVLMLDPIVANEGGPETPNGPALASVHPNPVRGSAGLRFTLGEASSVRLAVYDGLGRQVAPLHDGVLGAGTHAATFDATALPPGVYFARLEAGGRVATQALTVVR
ncbi:MAG TPA: choice-of-anchor B family protein [Rubricoccaceae bacterium]|nr:choice-of-anchor B family protein [Rubricoccaceae bacterium]